MYHAVSDSQLFHNIILNQVVFEAVLASEKSVELEWTICDIDDWLEGNEFWQPSRTRKAPTVAPHNTNTRFKDK